MEGLNKYYLFQFCQVCRLKYKEWFLCIIIIIIVIIIQPTVKVCPNIGREIDFTESFSLILIMSAQSGSSGPTRGGGANRILKNLSPTLHTQFNNLT